MWGYFNESKMYKERYGGTVPSFGTSYWFYPQIFRYLDERGRLYTQFRLNGAEMYADISLPLINLEGRLEHAEN